jgi:hypothetical protein
MIIVANPGKPFELTVKGTPRRHVVLDTYADEIEKAYAAVERPTQMHLLRPVKFTHEGQSFQETITIFSNIAVTGSFISVVVFKIFHECHREVVGLQATWLRNTILHAISTTTVKVDSFVYSNPTICKLASYVEETARGSNPSTEKASNKSAGMQAMAHTYSTGVFGIFLLSACVLVSYARCCDIHNRVGPFPDSASIFGSNVSDITDISSPNRHPYRPIHWLIGCST